jgi:hypothetical protein
MMTIPLGTCSSEGRITAIPVAGVGDAPGEAESSEGVCTANMCNGDAMNAITVTITATNVVCFDTVSPRFLAASSVIPQGITKREAFQSAPEKSDWVKQLHEFRL